MTEATQHHHHTEAYRRGDHSPEALEHEIDAERRSVSQTIEALQEKMSVSNMVDEAWRNYGHYGSDLGRTLGRTIAENPLPLILTGVGLAWLMASSGRRARRPYVHDEDYLREAEADHYEEDIVGTRRYGATAARPYGTAAVAGRYEDRGPSMTERVRGAAGSAWDSARRAVGSATHRAGSAGHSAYDSARDTASAASHAAGDAAHSTYDSARGTANSASLAAGDVAHSTYDGARGAASSASHAAGRAAGAVGDAARYAGDMSWQARRRAADYGRYSRRQFDDMLDDHPLVMGALALALGAAIGGALPRTRMEDEYMGEYSDEAWHMAEEEAGKARSVAGAVADEARHIAGEKYDELSGEARTLADRALHMAEEEGRGAAERAKVEAKDAANRLGDTAKEEARKQDLGHPGKHS